MLTYARWFAEARLSTCAMRLLREYGASLARYSAHLYLHACAWYETRLWETVVATWKRWSFTKSSSSSPRWHSDLHLNWKKALSFTRREHVAAANFYMHSERVIILLHIIRRKSNAPPSTFLFRRFIILIPNDKK